MLTRQIRKPTEGSVTKSVSMTEALADRIAAEASKEGHNNFSAIVTTILAEEFKRRDGEAEAA